MFVKKGPSGVAIMLVYVDDIFLTGNDHHTISQLKVYLREKLDIKDLGDFQFFLGIEVVKSQKGIFISHKSMHWICFLRLENLRPRCSSSEFSTGHGFR